MQADNFQRLADVRITIAKCLEMLVACLSQLIVNLQLSRSSKKYIPHFVESGKQRSWSQWVSLNADKYFTHPPFTIKRPSHCLEWWENSAPIRFQTLLRSYIQPHTNFLEYSAGGSVVLHQCDCQRPYKYVEHTDPSTTNKFETASCHRRCIAWKVSKSTSP